MLRKQIDSRDSAINLLFSFGILGLQNLHMYLKLFLSHFISQDIFFLSKSLFPNVYCLFLSQTIFYLDDLLYLK